MSKTNAPGQRETAFPAETLGTEHCPRVCNICTFPEALREKTKQMHQKHSYIKTLKRQEVQQHLSFQNV